MPKVNEATDTDLKIIDKLKELGWKPGDTLLYQQEYALTPEQQKLFEGEEILAEVWGDVHSDSLPKKS